MIAQPSTSALETLAPQANGLGLVAASLRVLVSPLLQSLGVRHGFTTRQGGVSTGRYESLNLGEKWGDDAEQVAENLRRVALEGGFAPNALCQVNQVHGISVAVLETVERRQRDADGMATRAPLCLGVYSADCVGMLFADGKGRVAAVHGGWRGTVDGIAGQAVAALVQLGAQPHEIRVALGPSIGPCCFEVQDDVASRFAQLPGALERRPDGRRFVNLRQANRHFLQNAGVKPAHIDDAPPCTHCDARRFYSYRRDGAGIGQHLSFIVGGGS